MSSVFRFKQFSVDQANCAMKVNTDAVLLAALVDTKDSNQMLDVGSGTGVIALMLAQRYPQACIDAVEIDEKAALTAGRNFVNSSFANRLKVYSYSFEAHFEKYPDKKYDLIISNPPFFIDLLRPDDPGKELARHTDSSFFERLIFGSAVHLNENGLLCLILPVMTAELIKRISLANRLKTQKEILIHSFPLSEPHRNIIMLGFDTVKPEIHKFVIYEQQKIYSDEYSSLLKDFLTIF